VVLTFDYAGAEWPWRYRATQVFTVAGDTLEVALTVANRSDSEMPCGLGLHPYYVRDPDMTLTASLDGMWETDAEIMPTALRSVPRRDDWTGVLHGKATTDNVFTGWDGRAVIGFPSRGFAVEMTADAGWMVVYAPTTEAIACIEPVTHPTDPFNDPAHDGLRLLAPGEATTLTTRFRISATGFPG
jgi:aldose 1-epimerase